jgi:hypothetical protein
MMVNEQNSHLGFPAGLRFSPYAFFRNVASEVRTLHLSAWYQIGNTAKQLTLPDLVIQPGQARELDIHDVLKSYPEVSDLNLLYEYTGDYADILAATGSTDGTGNYVFPILPEAIAPSGAKNSAYWEAQGGFDTMYTIWNPTDSPEDVIALVRYGAGAKYSLPIHLEEYASSMVDIGELIRTQQPDQDGNIISQDAHQGSLQVSPATGGPEDLMTAVLSSGIYNPRKGTCGYNCSACSGITQVQMSPILYNISMPHPVQGSFTAWMNDGSAHDISSGSSWHSGSTSIATVQTTGQSSPGLGTGVSPGSTSFVAVSSPQSIYLSQFCGPIQSCPITSYGGGSPVTVEPTVAIYCTNLDLSLGSSAPSSTTSGTCTATANPAGGTYAWTASKSTISISGNPSGATANYTSNSASAAVGDTTVSVTYSLNSQTASATSLAITVHQPTSLDASTVNANGTTPCTLPCLTNPGNGTCNATPGTQCTYSANLFQRDYTVLDQFGTAFPAVGILNAAVTESVNLTSNNCGGSGVTTGSSSFTAFDDAFGKCDTCCQQSGPGCTTTAAQTLFVNGFSVRSTTITATCTTVNVVP